MTVEPKERSKKSARKADRQAQKSARAQEESRRRAENRRREASSHRLNAITALCSVIVVAVSAVGVIYATRQTSRDTDRAIHQASQDAAKDRRAQTLEFLRVQQRNAYKLLVTSAREERVTVSRAVAALKARGSLPNAFTDANFRPVWKSAQAAAADARLVGSDDMTPCIQRQANLNRALNDTARRMMSHPGWVPVTGRNGLIVASFLTTEQILSLGHQSLETTDADKLKVIHDKCVRGPVSNPGG